LRVKVSKLELSLKDSQKKASSLESKLKVAQSKKYNFYFGEKGVEDDEEEVKYVVKERNPNPNIETFAENNGEDVNDWIILTRVTLATNESLNSFDRTFEERLDRTLEQLKVQK